MLFARFTHSSLYHLLVGLSTESYLCFWMDMLGERLGDWDAYADLTRVSEARPRLICYCTEPPSTSTVPTASGYPHR